MPHHSRTWNSKQMTFYLHNKALITLLIATLVLAPVTVLASPTLLVFGDSLSAAYGLDKDDGWVSLLSKRLAREGYDYDVINASISGETTRGGLTRLPGEIQRHRPMIAIVELGANDGLRGLSLADMRRNLASIIEKLQAGDSHVVLVGMRLPPNYGNAYTKRFAQVYSDLGQRYEIRLVPFLLDGVANHRQLFQVDGLHPIAAAQPTLLNNVWSQLEPLLISVRH